MTIPADIEQAIRAVVRSAKELRGEGERDMKTGKLVALLKSRIVTALRATQIKETQE